MIKMTIKIVEDQTPLNPREDWDNCGTMVCFHKKYTLGDKDHGIRSVDFDGWDELEAYLWKEKEALEVLPIFMMDHSGVSVKTTPFGCSWDSGQIGFIYMSRSTALENFGKKIITKKVRDRVRECLEAEVQNYDQYLRGDVWGYVIEDENGAEVDSCYGYFGRKDVREEALRALEFQLKAA